MLTLPYRTYLLIAALSVCAASIAFSAETGVKEATVVRKPKDPALAWPEPDATEVAKLEKELKAELPADEFNVQRVGPWVVASDLSVRESKSFIEWTIAKSGGQIQTQLFTKKARSEPVKVYLFKDHNSYTIYNKKLFGEHPSTPYGYYSRQKRALVMNIGTGGGTLLHEMVHAMAEADFSEIPSWLNEGLGSLYECSHTNQDNGRIEGMANWRLTGLLKNLEAGTATKLKDLMKMDTTTFYGERSAANYATSRYLMQYLQDNGKLETFYTRIRDAKDADAETTLKGCFDNKLTVDEIEAKLFAWVKTLRIPL